MASSHKIRLALAIPLALTFFPLLILLFMSCMLPAFSGERIVLTLILLVDLYLIAEILCRRVDLQSEGLQIKRLLRSRELAWDEITHLGALRLGARIYLLLTTTRGFYILSNSYGRFPELLRYLSEKLGAGKTDEGICKLLEGPWKNNKPVYAAWLAVLVLSAVISGRLLPP